MNSLRKIIDDIGAVRVSELCGVSVRAVYKWRKANTLPRTEYTGETHYSEILAKALNNKLTSAEILKISVPNKQ